MKSLRQLDNSALNVLRVALDGYQRFENQHPESAAYFRKIIDLLIGSITELSVWGIRNLINQENERRIKHATVKVINPGAFDAIACLSEREQSVLRLIGEGQRSEAIQDLLSISYRTLATHKANIAAKLGLGSVRDLVKFAIDNLTIL